MTSLFKKRILEVVSKVPYGNVVSYGQVALYVGVPRGARQVGWILNGSEGVEIPWWRVVNNKGLITIKGSKYSNVEQRNLLLGEGVEVNKDFYLDMEKFRFRPNLDFIKSLKLDRDYLEMLADKIQFSRG